MPYFFVWPRMQLSCRRQFWREIYILCCTLWIVGRLHAFGLMADFYHVKQFSSCITKTFLTLISIICTISVSNHIKQSTSLIFYTKMMMISVVQQFLHRVVGMHVHRLTQVGDLTFGSELWKCNTAWPTCSHCSFLPFSTPNHCTKACASWALT